MGDKLQRTDGVGHSFEVIALPVREVIHRVGFPLTARAVVFFVDDAINDGVAEVHIRIGHVQLGAQHHGTFFRLAAVHLVKQFQIFFYGTVAIGARRTGLRRCSLLFAALFVDVGFAFFNQSDGKVPQLLKVVRSMIDFSPFESQPLYVLLDGLYVFRVFFDRVCVVQS